MKKTREDPKAQDQVGPPRGKAGKAVLAAAMLGLPALMVPREAMGQSKPAGPAKVGPAQAQARAATNARPIKIANFPIKHTGTYAVIGVGDGHTIFRAADGSMFYLDPATGDKRTVASDFYLKGTSAREEARKAVGGRNGGRAGGVLRYKLEDVLITSIVGRDADGNPVLRTAAGETFVLDPRTGDKIAVPNPK